MLEVKKMVLLRSAVGLKLLCLHYRADSCSEAINGLANLLCHWCPGFIM